MVPCIVSVFAKQLPRQVCLGVRAMHSYATPYAHRDVKPHNILLNPRAAGSSEGDGARFTAVLMDFGSAKPAHIVVMNRNAALAVQEEAEVSGFGGVFVFSPLVWAASCKQMVYNSSRCIAPTHQHQHVFPTTKVQQAQCTAAYRAPELFDVPSQCTIDEKVDIWSLGCTLYFMMYGESPFEKALNERGGSLALAIINAQVCGERVTVVLLCHAHIKPGAMAKHRCTSARGAGAHRGAAQCRPQGEAGHRALDHCSQGPVGHVKTIHSK